MRPLQTLANLTASLHERDYAVRGRHARRDDALGLAMAELGELADQLRVERWRDEEASTGLARVVEGLDAAVVAVDGGGVVRLANRTAERLVGRPLEGAGVAELDQLDQLLINLVQNAVEASAETGGGVRIAWSATGPTVAVVVVDDGHGVAATANLFVPFFTTKPTGSGIGLVLTRQIAEAHGGSLAVRNRKVGQGAEAVITKPTGLPAGSPAAHPGDAPP